MRPISGPSSMMATAAQALTGAATQIGLVGQDGPRAVAATIRSAFPPRRGSP